MLTVVEPGSDTRTEVGRLSERMVRLCVWLPSQRERLDFGELRALLTADLVRRVLREVHQRQVMVVAAGAAVDRAALRSQLNPLWVQEPAGVVASLAQAPGLLAGPVDLVVAPPGAGGPGIGDTLAIRVGEVTGEPGAAAGDEPLAMRMALLSWHYRQPVRLREAELGMAAGALRHWRDLVAAWASQPSVVMPDEVAKRAYAACDDDLDIPQILALLHRLEHDTDTPDGAKFESFAHLDRILALDLAAHLGSSQRG